MGAWCAVHFLDWVCATLREDDFLRFGAFFLAWCRRETDFGLGILGFSDSRLVQWLSLSQFLDCPVASRLHSAQFLMFLFFQQSSPECLQWAYDFEPKNKQYIGTNIVANMIILLPVSVEHSGQEPLCLREAYANLARNSGGLKGASKVKLTRNN